MAARVDRRATRAHTGETEQWRRSPKQHRMREEALTSDESTLLEESMYVALAPEVAKLLSQM